MATLGRIKATAFRITIHCETWIDGRFCVHSTQPNIDQLIQYLGVDFDINERRAEFLSRFKCEHCGGRNATMRVAPPFGNGHMDGAGGAHNHGPMPTAEERASRAAAFDAEFRRMGFKTNAELAVESRTKLKAERNAAKSGADFIGPPNPWSQRKRGRWL